jgi:hypothetical protein
MRGGKRDGAGRKPGLANKRTQALMDAVEASGITPLDYMLGQLRDETNSKEARMDAAKAAAPYVHAKLANIDASVKGNVDGTITFTWLPPS